MINMYYQNFHHSYILGRYLNFMYDSYRSVATLNVKTTLNVKNSYTKGKFLH